MAKKNNARTLILNDAAIRSKLQRIAWEIYESNYGQKSLVVIGIEPRGALLGKEICAILKEISSLKIQFFSGKPDSAAGSFTLAGEGYAKAIKDRNVVIVDDVLYSGRTLFLASACVLGYHPAKIETAALIDRGHRVLPIWTHFTGLELATTLLQHVSVEISAKTGKATAYLE